MILNPLKLGRMPGGVLWLIGTVAMALSVAGQPPQVPRPMSALLGLTLLVVGFRRWMRIMAAELAADAAAAANSK
jgi:hypothetical protein